MEGGNVWNSLEFLRGGTDQPTIKDSDAARAAARLLWWVEMLSTHLHPVLCPPINQQ